MQLRQASQARQASGQPRGAATPAAAAAPRARASGSGHTAPAPPGAAAARPPAALAPRRPAGRPAVAACAAAVEPAAPAAPAAAAAAAPRDVAFGFACPICLTTEFTVPASAPYGRACRCGRCGREFGSPSSSSSSSAYLDLTLTSGAPPAVYKQAMWQGTELFRQPLISFVYERGWRQGFARAGFPGPEREFEMAMDYLAPARGGVLVDASCGTGLFSRLFARSGAFAGVVALDFSESMLAQAAQYFRDDPALARSTPIVAVRADVGRLPFATGSVDAIHAGAAIHCWPNPQAAMAEISRVLRPGGVLVASTFLTPLAPLGELIGDATVRPLSQAFNPFGERTSNTFRYWEEAELVDLCAGVGLADYRRSRSRMFIMFSATKPGGQAEV
ncbi:methyltransferase [Scenedesmus sp. PABB004]|nr:methyltransferase [Scenedesmus sp. PABB004]